MTGTKTSPYHYKKCCILPGNNARSKNSWQICQEQCQGCPWQNVIGKYGTTFSWTRGKPLTNFNNPWQNFRPKIKFKEGTGCRRCSEKNMWVALVYYYYYYSFSDIRDKLKTLSLYSSPCCLATSSSFCLNPTSQFFQPPQLHHHTSFHHTTTTIETLSSPSSKTTHLFYRLVRFEKPQSSPSLLISSHYDPLFEKPNPPSSSSWC